MITKCCKYSKKKKILHCPLDIQATVFSIPATYIEMVHKHTGLVAKCSLLVNLEGQCMDNH